MQGGVTNCDGVEIMVSMNVRGLLAGIFDVSNAKDYSRTINVDLAVDLLRDKKRIYNIALQENHGNATRCKSYFTAVLKKARTFMKRRHEVWDRDELQVAIQKILSSDGNFVCLFGCKSTGKSLVIESIENRNMGNVFVVNLRQEGNDILIGLVAVLEERRRYFTQVGQYGNCTLSATTGNAVTDHYFSSLTEFKASNAQQPLNVLINELIEGVDGTVTLIIDEANLAFEITHDTKEERVEAQKMALALFTSLTKEKGKLNVILTSADHAFSHRLGDKRLGFNTMDITQLIFAGEVPPDKMYELLTKRWGMGHNLAVAFIDHYGGHIYDIFRRLEQLNSKGEDFVAMSQAQTDDVQMCLDFDGDKKHMRELLTQIAEKGFAPLGKKTDREAEVISQYNVGGLVQRDQAVVVGLPAHVWGENTIGLIASKHSIRLVIARVLHENPELLAFSAEADNTAPIIIIIGEASCT